MKPCLSISTNSPLLSTQQRSPMLGMDVASDGTNPDWAGKVGANNIAGIREQNFSKAEGIET